MILLLFSHNLWEGFNFFVLFIAAKILLSSTHYFLVAFGQVQSCSIKVNFCLKSALQMVLYVLNALGTCSIFTLVYSMAVIEGECSFTYSSN